MANINHDPSQRGVSRRTALGRIGGGLGAVVTAGGLKPAEPTFNPDQSHPLDFDFGGILVDRLRESDPTQKIGSVRFEYVQNYRPGSSTAGAVELSVFTRYPEGLLSIVSQQEYPDEPSRTTRTLFAGTYQYNEKAWHRSNPVIDAQVGDRLVVAVGLNPIDQDLEDPQVWKGLSLYRLQRLPNQEPGLVRIGRGFHVGLADFDLATIAAAEEKAHYDLTGKRRGP